MMDAGLITAGPIADGGVPIRSAATNSASTVGQGQSSNATQNDGSQSSFADVLQQSSDAQSNGQPGGQSSASSATTTSGAEAPALHAKSGDGGGPVIALPVIGGQLLAGPGAGMVGAPIVPVAGPVVLQAQVAGKDDSKVSAGSILRGGPSTASATAPAKNDMRKPMTIDSQGNEVPVTATPAAVVPVAIPVNVSTTVTHTADQDSTESTVPATKGTPSIAGDLSVVSRPAGAVTKNGKDAATHPASGDVATAANTAGSAGTFSQDAVTAASAVHSDVSQPATQHTAVAVDLAASAVGPGASNVAHMANPVLQTQTTASPAVNSTTSLQAGGAMIDGGSASGGEHATLIATPNVLEVGLSSGTHGWLRVRAEMSAGGDVSASVRPASEIAYDALHKELPSISAYLASERVGVTSLVVEHPPAISGTSATPGGSGMANATGNGQGSQADSRNGAADSSAWSAAGADAQGGDVALSELNIPDVALPVAAYANANGGWLSVRA